MPDLGRRRWLQGAAACLAGLPAAAAAPARIPLGFSLYGMKTLPTAEALRTCASLGYDGVELALMPGWPTEPRQLSAGQRQELRRQLGDAGLSLLSLMENLPEGGDDQSHRANLERLKAAAELAHALAPDAPPVLETILGGRPGQWEQVKDRLAERLRAWAAVAAAGRIVLAVKPHVSNALHTVDGAAWLLRQVDSPALRLAFDYSHFVLRGVPLETALQGLLPQTVFIHVKDARGTPDKVEFLLPGEGNIDYGRYFSLLGQSSYRGPVVVEVSGQISNRPGYDAIAAARRSYAALAPALAKAGLRARP